jgi:hypothetical protein
MSLQLIIIVYQGEEAIAVHLCDGHQAALATTLKIDGTIAAAVPEDSAEYILGSAE